MRGSVLSPSLVVAVVPTAPAARSKCSRARSGTTTMVEKREGRGRAKRRDFSTTVVVVVVVVVTAIGPYAVFDAFFFSPGVEIRRQSSQIIPTKISEGWEELVVVGRKQLVKREHLDVDLNTCSRMCVCFWREARVRWTHKK